MGSHCVACGPIRPPTKQHVSELLAARPEKSDALSEDHAALLGGDPGPGREDGVGCCDGRQRFAALHLGHGRERLVGGWVEDLHFGLCEGQIGRRAGWNIKTEAAQPQKQQKHPRRATLQPGSDLIRCTVAGLHPVAPDESLILEETLVLYTGCQVLGDACWGLGRRAICGCGHPAAAEGSPEC